MISKELDRRVDRFTAVVVVLFVAYMGTHLVLAYLAGNFS